MDTIALQVFELSMIFRKTVVHFSGSSFIEQARSCLPAIMEVLDLRLTDPRAPKLRHPQYATSPAPRTGSGGHSRNSNRRRWNRGTIARSARVGEPSAWHDDARRPRRSGRAIRPAGLNRELSGLSLAFVLLLVLARCRDTTVSRSRLYGQIAMGCAEYYLAIHHEAASKFPGQRDFSA